MPSPAIGVEMAIAWLPDPLRFEIAGKYWGAQTSSLATRPIGGDFQLLTLSARGCYGLGSGLVRLGPCLGGELEHMSAVGFGGPAPQQGRSAWGALTAGALFSWSVFPPFAVRLMIDAVAPLARPNFVVEMAPPNASQPVHRASVIGARGVLGGELRFF